MVYLLIKLKLFIFLFSTHFFVHFIDYSPSFNLISSLVCSNSIILCFVVGVIIPSSIALSRLFSAFSVSLSRCLSSCIAGFSFFAFLNTILAMSSITLQEPYLRESHNKMLSLINLKLLYMALKRKVRRA